jgi:hypothetical protein
LPELAHYEWVELAVDVMETSPPFAYNPTGNLLNEQPVLAAAAMNLAYVWPVHRIRPRMAATQTQRDAFAGVSGCA